MTETDGAGSPGEDRERDAPGNLPGDVGSRKQMGFDDEDPSTSDGSDEMTAAEQAGQVAFGGEDSSGVTGATGAESSSG